MANFPTAFTRPPADGRLRQLAIAAVLAFAALAGLELTLRSLGVEPSLDNGPGHWAVERAKASGPQSLALVGSSRFQLAIDPDTIRKLRPELTVANLAVLGHSPLPTLADLAADPAFAGTVLFEFHPWRMYTSDERDITRNQTFVNLYHSRAWLADLERVARTSVQSRLAFLNPEFNLKWLIYSIAKRVLSGEPIDARQFQRVLPNRHAPRDFEGWDAREYSERRVTGWRDTVESVRLSDEAVEDRMQKLHEYTRQIRARGGNVLFLRPIAYGPTRRFEAGQFPRERYWEKFAAQTPGAALHFEDMNLGEFDAPDDSHMDHRDASRYTRALIEYIDARNLLPRGR